MLCPRRHQRTGRRTILGETLSQTAPCKGVLSRPQQVFARAPHQRQVPLFLGCTRSFTDASRPCLQALIRSSLNLVCRTLLRSQESHNSSGLGHVFTITSCRAVTSPLSPPQPLTQVGALTLTLHSVRPQVAATSIGTERIGEKVNSGPAFAWRSTLTTSTWPGTAALCSCVVLPTERLNRFARASISATVALKCP